MVKRYMPANIRATINQARQEKATLRTEFSEEDPFILRSNLKTKNTNISLKFKDKDTISRI